MGVPGYICKNRHGTYYVRVVVPENKRKEVGQTEIRKSLRTKHRKKAIVRARHHLCGLTSFEINGSPFSVHRDDPNEEAALVTKMYNALQGTQPAQPVQPTPTSNSPLISQVIKEYIDERTPEWAPKTTYETHHILDRFVEQAGDMLIDQFGQANARKYKAHLQRLGVGRYTINKHLSKTGAMFNWR